MIEYYQGNVITAFKEHEFHVLAHQANCQNTFGSGVARQIKEEFPQAYAADCQTVKGDSSKLGGFTFAMAEEGFIFNLYGQDRYGREPGVKYTNTKALDTALKNMATFLTDIEYVGYIGMPKLGCGRGGADWDAEVKWIVLDRLKGFKVKVYSMEDIG